jgi:hypothetical protein
LQLQAEIQPPIQPHEGEQSITDAQQPVELKTTPQQTKGRQATSASEAKSRLKAIGDKLSVLALPSEESTENSQVTALEEPLSTSEANSVIQDSDQPITEEQPTVSLEEMAAQSIRE